MSITHMAKRLRFWKQYMTHSSLSSSMVTFPPLIQGITQCHQASGYDQQYGHMQCENKHTHTHTRIHLHTAFRRTHIHKHFICTRKNTSVHCVWEKKKNTTVTEISKSPPSQCWSLAQGHKSTRVSWSSVLRRRSLYTRICGSYRYIKSCYC